MTRPRILLADNHPGMLDALYALLKEVSDVVGAVTDGHALVEAAQQHQPDIILLDISMPQLNGFEAARELRRLVPQSKLIFVTIHNNPTYVIEAFQAGASGYLLKRSAAAEVPQAIEQVLKGNFYLSPELRESSPSPSGGDMQDPFTPV